MSKTIPLQLLTTLKKPGRSTCYLVKVVDADGTAHGFAGLDAIVRFNDGFHNVVYQPDEEMAPQNILNTANMDVDSTDLLGWFGPGVEQLVLSGLFNSAEITIYRVAYLRTEYGAEVVAYGTVGDIEYSTNKQGKRKMEFRSISQELKMKVNDQFSLTCRADFGDEDCGMPFVWEAATIVDVEDNFLRFQVSGIARPDNWFVLGVVKFLDGDNATKTLEIESWTTDGWLTLSFVTPYAIPMGGLVELRQDCDKTATSCKDYGNIVNMQAEHLTPVQDLALMVPGAYIKSDNAL